MLTFEDLVAVGEDEKQRIDFVLKVIQQHQQSAAYRAAKTAEMYYDGENPTIMQYEKIIYDMKGKAHVDMWTANHKIASQFFPFVIDQEVSYLLGNGIRFNNEGTKDQLGKDFDQEVMDALEYARIGGSSFGFWNLDHIEVFKLTEFAPLYGEENGALMAGVRWWQLEKTKPLRATLYELDGFTEYIRENGKDMVVLKKKQPYKENVRFTEAEGEEITDGENYDGFPVVPLYANKAHKSVLNGKKNTVDALDLLSSNRVNNCDEGNLIYWVLTNCGGMDDLDDAKFVERLKTSHVAHADGDAGASVEAHTVEAPVEGTRVTKQDLKDQLHEDFQTFDAKAMTASDMSATAIKAGYTRLDMKTDKIEREVTRFINGILALAGIDDDPTYQRNQMVNATEETQRILMQAEYFDAEYITKKLLAINGDIDQYKDLMKRMDAENANRLKEMEQKLAEAEAQNAAQQAQQPPAPAEPEAAE